MSVRAGCARSAPPQQAHTEAGPSPQRAVKTRGLNPYPDRGAQVQRGKHSGLPNEHWSSDHIALMAEFVYRAPAAAPA
jgi:hypothetical protein